MIYLISHFWAWGLSAFAVGIATALSVGGRPARGWFAGWLVWFGLAFAVGLPVAYLHLLPGRPGFWLEIGLALFAAFIVGSVLGAIIGGRSLRDHEGWAIGLIPLALICLGVDALAGRALELYLERKAASAVEKVGGDPLYLDVAGRDVLLPRDAAGRAEAEEEIARIPGVRRVAEVDALSGPAAKAYENALAARRAAREGELSGPAPTPAEPAGKGKEPSAVKPAPVAPAPEKARPSENETRMTPGAVVAALPATGDLDPAACQTALTATLAQEQIQFRQGSAAIRRASNAVLGRVTAYLKRCPQAKVEVRSYGEAGDRDAHRLARERAERVVDYLARMGVDRARLAVAGQAGPVSKDTPDSGGKSGIEFVVRPPG